MRFRWFRRSRKSLDVLDDWRWHQVQSLENALRGTWGLGGDEGGEGYRNRLQRLCDFLRELEPGPAGTDDRATDFARLERGLAVPQNFDGAREDNLRRLGDLRRALEDVVPARRADGNRHWQCGEGWTPRGWLPAERQSSRDRALVALGVLPGNRARPDHSARGCLGAMSDLLDVLEAGATGDAAREQIKQARGRWQQALDDCAGDWEWAWLQVLIRLARECLQDQPHHPQCCAHLRTAKEALEEAIKWLERQGSSQHLAQGLYGLLAATCLMLGKARDTPPDQRLRQLESALVHARHAVAMEPESSRERLVLLQVLSAFGDPEDIRAQAEIALHLDSGSGTLRTIGESYWGRTAVLRSRGVRRKLLREAARFFAQALNEVESAPLDERSPRQQIEAHAWAHFWRGRFQEELGRFAAAAAHLETACKLGFKPLEARVELAWTCMLAHDRKRADEAFRETLEEVARRRAAGPAVAAAPGESRPVVELAFEAHLGWALLCADWDPDRAEANARQAKKLLPAIGRTNDPQLLAALSEVRGRVALHRRKLRASIDLLEESVRSSPRSGAYYALGLASLGLVRTTGKGTPAALKRAAEAYRLGRDCDVRRRHGRELRELRRELRKRGVLRGPREASKPETPKPEPSKPETPKPEPSKPETPKQERQPQAPANPPGQGGPPVPPPAASPTGSDVSVVDDPPISTPRLQPAGEGGFDVAAEAAADRQAIAGAQDDDEVPERGANELADGGDVDDRRPVRPHELG